MRELFKLSLQIMGIILVLALIQNPVLAKEKKDISAREAVAAEHPPAREPIRPEPKPAAEKPPEKKKPEKKPAKKPAEKKSAAKKPPANAILQTAAQYLGAPYKFGGTDAGGFDCSGYVVHVFQKHGKKLPRAADEQFQAGSKVAKNKLKEGDLVFFTTDSPGASHVGIYYGKNEFIHVSSSKGVMISKFDDIYWQPRYLGARRVL
ncbi:MAG: C40 family peptidase [Sporomusaceae bacterium]|nr:C40 family peptidase [Sporomusaceae bacterium]